MSSHVARAQSLVRMGAPRQNDPLHRGFSLVSMNETFNRSDPAIKDGVSSVEDLGRKMYSLQDGDSFFISAKKGAKAAHTPEAFVAKLTNNYNDWFELHYPKRTEEGSRAFANSEHSQRETLGVFDNLVQQSPKSIDQKTIRKRCKTYQTALDAQQKACTDCWTLARPSTQPLRERMDTEDILVDLFNKDKRGWVGVRESLVEDPDLIHRRRAQALLVVEREIMSFCGLSQAKSSSVSRLQLKSSVQRSGGTRTVLKPATWDTFFVRETGRLLGLHEALEENISSLDPSLIDSRKLEASWKTQQVALTELWERADGEMEHRNPAEKETALASLLQLSEGPNGWVSALEAWKAPPSQ